MEIPRRLEPDKFRLHLSGHPRAAFLDEEVDRGANAEVRQVEGRFARAIKRIFGITPAQLITKTRITAGARLLRETGRSIADIALECGFTDHSAFTRAFRAVTQTSPTEYRKANATKRGSAS